MCMSPHDVIASIPTFAESAPTVLPGGAPKWPDPILFPLTRPTTLRRFASLGGEPDQDNKMYSRYILYCDSKCSRYAIHARIFPTDTPASVCAVVPVATGGRVQTGPILLHHHARADVLERFVHRRHPLDHLFYNLIGPLSDLRVVVFLGAQRRVDDLLHHVVRVVRYEGDLIQLVLRCHCHREFNLFTPQPTSPTHVGDCHAQPGASPTLTLSPLPQINPPPLPPATPPARHPSHLAPPPDPFPLNDYGLS